MRNHSVTLALAGVLAGAVLAPAAHAGEEARIARALARFGPSVVPVHYTLRLLETPRGGQGDKVEGVMCGVLVGSDGLVVTMADVFPDLEGDPRQIFVPVAFTIRPPGGGDHRARAVGLDRALNLAFLRLERPEEFPARGVTFARRAPVPGERVLLLGLLGEQHRRAPTITQTRIAAVLNRPHTMFTVDTLVQDLTIGGLVVSLKGDALGIVGEDTLVNPPAGPSDMAAAGNVLSLFSSLSQGQRPGYPVVFPYRGLLAERLASPPPIDENEWSNRGWLGIIMQPLSRELADYWRVPGPGGVVIGAVLDGSPAEAAGLQVGDVILQVDHAPVPVREQKDLGRFRDMVQTAGVGREVPLLVFRDGSQRLVPLTLASRPKTVYLAEEEKDETFGLTVKEITFDFLQATNMPSSTRGVFVAEVENAGWADVGGISLNDVIMQIDGRDVASVESYREVMEEVRARRPREVVFFVRRGPLTQFVAVKADW